MRKWRRLTGPFLALAALAFLVAMVLIGAQPVHRQIALFEARGVLTIAPERIRRVEVVRGDEQLIVVRTGERSWATPEGRDIGPEAGSRLSMAVQMMHTSGPANEITAAELAQADIAGFELDPPQLVARLYEDRAPVLVANFGGRNPDGFLQYMRIDGDPRIFLMSRFVGQEWQEALNRSFPR
jgi:hypothetical protein